MKTKYKYYKFPQNALYSEGRPFGWPGSFDEAQDVLDLLPRYKNTVKLFENCSFSDPVNGLRNWNLKDLTFSALYFYLEKNITEKQNRGKETDLLTPCDWIIISRLILNSPISSDRLFFLEQLDLRKISTEKIIISGSKIALQSIYTFDESDTTKIGLTNLLLFLKLDLTSSKSLTSEAFKTTSAKNILAFLLSFDEFFSKRRVLTETLKSYKSQKLKISKGLEEQIKIYLSEIYEDQINEFDHFEPFDIFDSSENFKARTPQILYSSLSVDLFKDLNYSEDSITLELFKLFEDYLMSSKDKIFLYKTTTVESFKEFAEITEGFISAKRSEIENILKEKVSVFSSYIEEITFKKLIGCILLAALLIITSLGLLGTSKNQINNVKKNETPTGLVYQRPPFGSLSMNFSQGRRMAHGKDEPVARVQKLPQQSSQTATSVSQGAQKVTYKAEDLSSKNALQKSGIAPSTANATPLKKFDKSQQQATVSSTAKVTPLENSDESKQQSITKEEQSTALLTRLNTNSTYIEPKQVVAKLQLVTTQIDGESVTVANVVSSSGTSCDLGTLTRNFNSGLEQNPELIGLQNVSLDREHASNLTTRTGVTIPKDQGGSFLFIKNHHVMHTRMMDYTVPDNIGYKDGSGTWFDLHECHKQKHGAVIDTMYNGSTQASVKAVQELTACGLTPKDVKESSRRAFDIDRNTVSGMGIDKKVILPWSNANIINHKQAQAFSDFALKGEPGYGLDGMKYNAQSSSDKLGDALARGFLANDHNACVLFHFIEPGSDEEFHFLQYQKAHHDAARRAIAMVERSGGVVDPKAVTEYFNPNRDIIELDAARSIAFDEFGLSNPKKGCKSVFSGYDKRG